MAIDLAKIEEDRQIVSFTASLGALGRGLTLPTGAPKKLNGY